MMKLNTTAKTNNGQELDVSLYRGYKGAICISFGQFSGWGAKDLALTFNHHEMCLNGGENVVCTNIQEVLNELRIMKSF